MAYIEPNSELWICRNVNLEPSYTNTIYFISQGSQITYFSDPNIRKYRIGGSAELGVTYPPLSYQRANRNRIRVKLKYENLIDCNYLCFKNTSFENKWFYAFITAIEYINNNCTEIEYQLDVMQTWMFDYTLNPCFVEREHSETDIRGENILPEPIRFSEYRTGNLYTSGLFSDYWCIVIACSADIDNLVTTLVPAKGVYSCGIYNNINYYVVPVTQNVETTRDSIQALLDGLRVMNRENTVINMYMCPHKFVPKTTVGSGDSQRQQTWSESVDASHYGYIQPNISPSFGTGWTPNNNKLLTYPYCYYTVTNQQGETKYFKYEGFLGGSQNRFEVYYQNSLEPEVQIIPVGYLQTELQNNNAYLNHDFAVTIKGFPKCTWATNDLMAKFVQAGIGLSLNALFGGITGSNTPVPILPLSETSVSDDTYRVNGISAKKIPSGYETDPKTFEQFDGYKKVNQIELDNYYYNTINAIGTNGNIPRITSSIGNSSINFLTGGIEFIFKEYHLSIEQAKAIDAFFDMYGYQTNLIKIPNRNVRPHWTYTKTTNCTINGNIPQDDVELIQKIYNHGITFWKSPNEVGNYSLDNRVGQG